MTDVDSEGLIEGLPEGLVETEGLTEGPTEGLAKGLVDTERLIEGPTGGLVEGSVDTEGLKDSKGLLAEGFNLNASSPRPAIAYEIDWEKA